MKKAIGLAAVAWLSHVGSAAAAPAWCKDAKVEDRYDLSNLSSKDIEYVITTIVKATCKPTSEAQANAAQIEAARQAWGKKLGMSDADWADAVAFTNNDRPKGLEFSTKDAAAMTALDQYHAIRDGISPTNTFVGYDEPDYLADMFEPNLTEVGRFGYIERCIDYSASSYIPAVTYAQCQADIDGFDRAKFATQLRADTAHPGENKMAIRFKLYGLPPRLKEHAEKVQTVQASDAAYKKLWEAAARGRAAFASTITDKSLQALATKLDGAAMFQSRKQFEGCEASTDAALAKVIGTKVSASLFKDAGRDVPKAQDDLKEDLTSVGSRVAPLMSDIPELMFVVGPYVECHKDDSRARFLSGLFQFSVGFRGPRRAALAAITHEKIVLDDMSATITYPKTGQPFGGPASVGTDGAIVKSVKEQGDLLMVAPEKLLVKREECVQSHRTKKITRVNSDGTISYELICDKYGTVTYDDTPADSRIDKVYKPLLKKGVQFSAYGTALFAVWPSKDAKLPTHVLGVEVK